MSLADFLAAKFALDERSLNRTVRTAFVEQLAGLAARTCVDVGAGTGASVERLLAWRFAQPWHLTLLDQDADLLAIARTRAVRLLEASGHRPRLTGERIETGDARIELRFAACAIDRHAPARAQDAVIAHGVMDLLPLESTLARFGAWLRPGGYLYAAINYDGETLFAPSYCEPALESALLACYNDSMEARRVDDRSTGGAYCGRRLRALLPRHGFALVCEGRSDWHIHPHGNLYPDGDRACLAALVAFVVKEAQASGRFPTQRIAHWREDRLQRIAGGELELRVRNLDVLARYTGFTAHA